MNDSFFEFSIENDWNETQKGRTLGYRRNVRKRYVQKVAPAAKTQGTKVRFLNAFSPTKVLSRKSLFKRVINYLALERTFRGRLLNLKFKYTQVSETLEFRVRLGLGLGLKQSPSQHCLDRPLL